VVFYHAQHHGHGKRPLSYKARTVEDQDLFEEKQKFMYSVFEEYTDYSHTHKTHIIHKDQRHLSIVSLPSINKYKIWNTAMLNEFHKYNIDVNQINNVHSIEI